MSSFNSDIANTSHTVQILDETLIEYPVIVPVLTQSEYLILTFVSLSLGEVIACFGVVTNIINIKTFIAMGIGDGVTALFLSISFTDFAYVILIVLRNSMDMMAAIEKYSPHWLITVTDPRAILFFSDNCAYVIYAITILTSTFLAVARCMCVVKPLHFKHMFTRSRCIKALIPMYLFPIACQIPVFFNMGVKPKLDISKNASRPTLWLSSDRERVHDIARLILSSIVPLSSQGIIIVCVIVMIVKLRESAQFRKNQSTDDTDKGLSGKEVVVIKQVVLISIIYVVLNIYKIVRSLIMTLDARFAVGQSHELLYNAMADVKVVFESLNASVNIFVYYIYNSKFRSLCFTC